MVSTLGLARDTEASRPRQGRIAAYPRELGVRSLSGTNRANCSERGQRRETRKLRRSGCREVNWPMATTTLVAPEYAYQLAGISDALYDLHEPEPSQSFTLIASSVAGYTSVPLVSTCAADVSFAGSTLPLPMMCMTRTPCANR
jgi:hypothetical protein